MSDVTIPDLGYKPNSYGLHNGSPLPYTVRWTGLQFSIPPCDKVGDRPVLDADGEPVPGSYMVTDSWSIDRDGLLPDKNSPPNWLAFEAIRNVLGIDPVTKEPTGTAAKSGISFLPNNPTKEIIQRVAEAGRARWQNSRYEWAQHQIAAYRETVDRSKQVNVQPPPPGRDYQEAIAILNRRAAEEEKLVNAALEQAKAVGGTDAQEDGETKLEFLAFAQAKAMEFAEKVAAKKPNVDKAALAKELAEDEGFLHQLRKQGFKIRKKGYLEPEA